MAPGRGRGVSNVSSQIYVNLIGGGSNVLPQIYTDPDWEGVSNVSTQICIDLVKTFLT